MFNFKKLVLTTVMSISLVACAQDGSLNLNKENIGTVLGAVGGAAVGSQFGKGSGNVAMIAVGTLGGAWIGGQIGASLDRADQLTHTETAFKALESNKAGVASGWRNPDKGTSGEVTPTRTYQQAGGEYCREFTQKILIGGKEEESYGKACRQPGGAWKIS